jgi:GntR family transcriptional regulator / MocR family aminotransferase
MRHTTYRVAPLTFRETPVKSRQSWAELYAFEIDRAADAPVFRQIYLQLRSAILSGTLRPETKLPSTRELAAQLGVSRSAVISAFEQLLAEGYAFGKKGAGTYIACDLPEPFQAIHGRKKRPASVVKPAPPFRDLDGFIDVTAQSDDRPFNLGRTLVDARTAELWRKLSARTLRSFGRHHLGYGDPHGMLELRKSVCDYLQAARGVRCETEQVVITAGTQQAVDIVARIIQGPDKEVWIEDPGYSLTRLALVAAGAKVCPTTEAMCWAHARRKFFDVATSSATSPASRRWIVSACAPSTAGRSSPTHDVAEGAAGETVRPQRHCQGHRLQPQPPERPCPLP